MSTVRPAVPSTDPAEFEAGVLEFAGRLRAFIRRRISDPNDAEDIAQEVFLKVFRARGSLRDPGRLGAWLYQTARAAIADHYRRRRPTQELPAALPAEPRELDEVGARLRRSVRRFLATLPERYRRPLELAEFQGLPAVEIGRRLALSETAVKSRLARGRAQLRKKLLGCCQFEFDTFGRVIDLRRRIPCACDAPAAPMPGSRGRHAHLPPLTAFALAVDDDEPAIRALLKTARLPVDGLTGRHFLNFVTARVDGRLVGCAGIEVHEKTGLLRSVAVAPALQGRGIGARLIAEAEDLAAQLGLKELYLLTTTAGGFFAGQGYEPVRRTDAPASIRSSREFSTLCPDSAVLMRKRLPRPAPTPLCC